MQNSFHFNEIFLNFVLSDTYYHWRHLAAICDFIGIKVDFLL